MLYLNCSTDYRQKQNTNIIISSVASLFFLNRLLLCTAFYWLLHSYLPLHTKQTITAISRKREKGKHLPITSQLANVLEATLIQCDNNQNYIKLMLYCGPLANGINMEYGHNSPIHFFCVFFCDKNENSILFISTESAKMILWKKMPCKCGLWIWAWNRWKTHYSNKFSIYGWSISIKCLFPNCCPNRTRDLLCYFRPQTQFLSSLPRDLHQTTVKRWKKWSHMAHKSNTQRIWYFIECNQ